MHSTLLPIILLLNGMLTLSGCQQPKDVSSNEESTTDIIDGGIYSINDTDKHNTNAVHAQTSAVNTHDNKTLIINLVYRNGSYKVMHAKLVSDTILEKTNIKTNDRNMPYSFSHQEVGAGSNNTYNSFVLKGILSNYESEEGYESKIHSESTFVVRSIFQEELEVLNILNNHVNIKNQSRAIKTSQKSESSVDLAER